MRRALLATVAWLVIGLPLTTAAMLGTAHVTGVSAAALPHIMLLGVATIWTLGLFQALWIAHRPPRS